MDGTAQSGMSTPQDRPAPGVPNSKKKPNLLLIIIAVVVIILVVPAIVFLSKRGSRGINLGPSPNYAAASGGPNGYYMNKSEMGEIFGPGRTYSESGYAGGHVINGKTTSAVYQWLVNYNTNTTGPALEQPSAIEVVAITPQAISTYNYYLNGTTSYSANATINGLTYSYANDAYNNSYFVAVKNNTYMHILASNAHINWTQLAGIVARDIP